MPFFAFLPHCEYKPQTTAYQNRPWKQQQERGVVCKLQNNLIQNVNFQEGAQNIEHISKDL